MTDRSDQFVPGQMRCAKCNFGLTRTNLYVNSGTVGPGDNKTEPCPNGCGPLWPVTWRDSAEEGWKAAEQYFGEIKELERLAVRVFLGKQTASDIAKLMEIQERHKIEDLYDK